MQIANVIEELAEAGVYLTVIDGKLVCKANEGALTPERRQLIGASKADFLAFLDRGAADRDAQEPPLLRRPTGPAPLSATQQRLWFIDRLTGANYTIPVTYRLSGPLDADALCRAMQRIVERHESLRSVVGLDEHGQPFAVIQEQVDLAVEHADLSALDCSEQESQIRQRLQAAVARSFDLARDIPLRAQMLRLGADAHVLLLTVHHIASDGWSVENLLAELSTLYRAFQLGQSDPLPALSLQYADYAAWQKQWLQGERLQRELGYWRSQLAGAPAVHSLPLDFPRPTQSLQNGATWRQCLPASLYQAIKTLSQSLRATPFMTLQTAFAMLIARWSGETDIVIGTPVANRPRNELGNLIGFFSNTLALRSSFADNPNFIDAAQRTRTMALDAYKFQHLPFEVLVEDLNPPRNLNHGPLFQIMFSLQDTDERSAFDLPGIAIAAILPDCSNAKFDLNLSLFETANGLEACWDYSSELFGEDTIACIGQSFEVLLNGIVAEPNRRLDELPLLDASEQRRVLAIGNEMRAQYAQPSCLHELIEIQVERNAEAIAVIQEGLALSYGELNRRANRLAHHLRDLGVGPDLPVAIIMDRCPDMIVAMLAILKAGGAFVPIEPDQPEHRLAFLLGDSAPIVVLGCGAATTRARSILADLPTQTRPPLIDLIVDAAQWEGACELNIHAADIGLSSRNLAYIIYTSGSTGQPKGVMNEHHAVANRMRWMQEVYAHSPSDRVLQKTPMGFDVSVREIFLSLMAGARLVQARVDGHRDPGYLVDLIAAEKVTVAGFVPSMLEVFLDHPRIRECTSIGRIFCGGETLPGTLARRCRSMFPDIRLHNLYGPTEAAVSVTAWDCIGESIPDTIPIGKPGTNVRIYILDERGNPVPRGMRGEIHIGGCQVARGYLNLPELSAERFISDPFSTEAGAHMYRSGDLGRLSADGNIEFLGRNDFQVKIRGQRVELGEIEAHLRNVRGVAQAAVIARDFTDGTLRLVAYLVVDSDRDDQVLGEARSHLQHVLPAHMLPSAFVHLSQLPVTANGKLDLKALPAPESNADETTHHTPAEGALEIRIATMWQDLLQREQIDVTANFFDMGGHSLLLTRLHNRMHAAFGFELSLRELFGAPTIREQADLIAFHQQGSCTDVVPAPRPRPTDAPMALSFAQRRLWFIDQMGEAGAVYNIPCALRLRGVLDRAALTDALQSIVERHEVLRTVLVSIDGEAAPRVLDEVTIRATIEDLSKLDDLSRASELRRQLDAEAARPFALSTDIFLRARILCLAEHEHVLLLTIHHIAADGWSMGVLLSELAELYNSALGKRDAELPALSLQYSDYAHWQQQWLQGERLERQWQYWRDQLDGLPILHNLPIDFARPETQLYRGAIHWQQMPAELLIGIQNLARRYEVTPFIALQTAFAILLARWSGDTDIVIGTPIANRRHEELAPLIGFFVNTLVLRNRIISNASFASALLDAKKVALDAFQHQDFPFEMLVDRLRPPRSLGHSPLFQVMLSFDNNGSAIVPLDGLAVDDVASDSHYAKFDLTLNLRETDSGLQACWDYNRDLFRADTIERIAASFETLLLGIVAAPDRPISELPLVVDGVSTQPVLDRPPTALPAVAGVHELIEAWAQRRPEGIAVRDDTNQISYVDLNQRSNRLAHALREIGVGADVRVAIHVDRSIDMVIGLFAILKAGGAYVPLDPAHPQARRQAILEDSGAVALLTQTGLRDALSVGELPRLLIDDASAFSRHSNCNSANVAQSRKHLAYVLYTSGSAGTPKGVMVEHGNLLNLVEDGCRRFLDEGAIEASFWTSFGFDVSVFELFVTLALGGTLNIVPGDIRADADGLLGWLAETGITHAYLPPFFMRRLREYADDKISALSLRRLLVGVEPLQENELHHLRRLLPQLHIHNGYGPTETTVYSTCYSDIRALVRNAPIGTPIINTHIDILDDALQPVPIGVVGEIHVRGLGVARGYLNQAELSAERFISHASGARMYRTGDLGRWLAEGQIEFRGRKDQQIKFNGVRIEPGEIEAALRAHAGVRDVAVVLRKPKDAENRLVAYVVPSEDSTSNMDELRDHLADRLPAYMLPAAYVSLDRLPLTVSGKLDARALPEPDMDAYTGADHVPPQTPLEQKLATIWQELLDHEQISVTANFFDLGGHSLNAVRLMSSIRDATGKALPISILFKAPTIRALAAQIESHMSAVEESFVTLREGGSKPPLFVLHAAGGDVLCYQPLLQYLDPDMPVHGLARSELPTQRVPAFKSVEQLADDYIARLLKHQPEGPYHLAGWSSGGLLVMEIASRLEQQGKKIATIALIDTMLATGTGIPASYHETGLNQLQKLPAQPACELMRDYDSALPKAIPQNGVLDVSATDYFNFLVAANQIGIDFHKPDFLLETQVHYFGCSRNENFKTVSQRIAEIQKLVSKPIVCMQFDATHFSIMEEPDVAQLGPALAAIIAASTTTLDPTETPRPLSRIHA
ncbi:MAG: amino acid adenylation domain-containing protein [Dokdonella sp.]